MGNTSVVVVSFSVAAKPLARYGAICGALASGFAGAAADPGFAGGRNSLGPKGLSRGSSLQASWSK